MNFRPLVKGDWGAFAPNALEGLVNQREELGDDQDQEDDAEDAERPDILGELAQIFDHRPAGAGYEVIEDKLPDGVFEGLQIAVEGEQGKGQRDDGDQGEYGGVGEGARQVEAFVGEKPANRESTDSPHSA